MIARTWRGTVRRSHAEAYAGYIRDTGFTEYARTEPRVVGSARYGFGHRLGRLGGELVGHDGAERLDRGWVELRA